jgi:hypothetical protein
MKSGTMRVNVDVLVKCSTPMMQKKMQQRMREIR